MAASNQAQEIGFVQRTMKKLGLTTDPKEAIALLARGIRNHAHFERILTEAEPEIRQELYDSCKPSLKFEAKPLDVYIADAKARAERMQWAVLGPDGSFQPFSPARDAASAVLEAEHAIAQGLAKRTLTLTCSKCTMQQQFYAVGEETNVDVVKKARREGWIYDYRKNPGVEICPTCPTSLRHDA